MPDKSIAAPAVAAIDPAVAAIDPAVAAIDPAVAAIDPAVTAIDIVPIGPAEAGTIVPIHAASLPDAWNEAALARLLRADAARAYGAFSGYARTPLGFVLAFAAAGEAEILTIAVAPGHRRAGIAAKLLRALRAQLVEEAVERLYLEVAADNFAAIGLYRRFGFVETGRRKGYYMRPEAPAVDALTLALSLDRPPNPLGPSDPLLR